VKLIEALSLFDHWEDDEQLPSPVARHHWAKHVVQAHIWGAVGISKYIPCCSYAEYVPLLGCDRLAEIEEAMIISFTEEGSQDNNRITAILNRAYKVRE
jgi:anaphase-promoting complex subunit 5